MKIRIQNSDRFINVDVDHPYELGNPEISEVLLNPKIQQLIDKDNLKCDGCGSALKDRSWICVNHRPKSAGKFKESLRMEDEKTGEVYGEGEYQIEDVWAIFLFCFDTREKCMKKWTKRRPR